MTVNQTDLFGEATMPELHIDGNPMLASICRHILDLVSHDPRLLNGDTPGQVDRQLMIMIWLDDGLRALIPDIPQRKAIIEWLRDPKQCLDPDAIGRARRYLQERDMIRLSAKAVVTAENHRQRIARSVK